MANGAFNFKDSNGNIVSFISGSGPDIIMSGGTLNLSSMTGLTLGNLTMEGTVETASFAPNYLLTSSFESYTGTTDTIIGDLQISTSSLNSFTSSATTRLNLIEGKTGSYATTGSNQFDGSQSITGSLTVTGDIIAQTLNVQQVTSSVVYSSGSNVFGNNLSNTHQFTGSLSVTGSLALNGLSAITGTGTRTENFVPKFGSGGNTIQNSLIFDNGTNVGVNNNNPNRKFLVQEAGTSTSGNVIGVRNDNSTSGAYINFIAAGTNAPSIGAKGNDITITADGYNGTELMRITSGGNVGINKNNPGSKLDIKGENGNQLSLDNAGERFTQIAFNNNSNPVANIWYDNTDSNLVIQSGASKNIAFQTGGTTERMRITSGGDVGINETNPSARLTIKGESGNQLNLDNGGQRFTQQNFNINGNQRGALWVDGTLTSFNMFAPASWGLAFWAGATERMRITSGGNLGIGTDNPQNIIHVAKNQNVSLFQSTTTTSPAELQVYNTTNFLQMGVEGVTGGTRMGGTIAYNAYFGSFNNYGITFHTNNSNRMTITSGGNILINTTSDNGARLQVSGLISVAGGLRFSSSGADANRWSVFWNGATGDLIVVNNLSDIRIKKDFDYDIKGLETIKKLKPLKFTWKDGISRSTSVSGKIRQYGFIAQETMEADNYLAWYNESQDTWGIEQYESFTAVIVKAVQEQQTQIETLKAENKTLTMEIQSIKDSLK
jgi:hypothetical protein